MRNKLILKPLIIIFLLGIVFSSVKYFQSSHLQSFLMYDFNKDSYNVPYQEYANNLDVNFPNLSHTVLPMKFIQARYYLKDDSLETAKKLLYGAIKDNPFIKGPEQMLAKIFIKQENYDSAYFYSREAFYKMPNANPHRFTYFRVLQHLKDSTELDKAFSLIKNRSISGHWYDYIYTKHKLSPDHEVLTTIIEEFKTYFPNEDFSIIDDLQTLIDIGSEAYTLSSLLGDLADKKFSEEKYEEAIDLYEKAIDFNQNVYTYYENAAIAYDLTNNFDSALNYYDNVIYNFKTIDGRSEFYKGLMLLRTDKLEEGCAYLKIASNKQYIGSAGAAANVYIALCLNKPNN